jgi:hypothetical protein
MRTALIGFTFFIATIVSTTAIGASDNHGDQWGQTRLIFN